MRHGSDCKQLGCFSLINPQESVEDPGSQLRTTGCFGPVNPEESAGTLELIANNGVGLGHAGHQGSAGARVHNCIHAWVLFYT